jgi:hypothetical protein
MHARYCRAWPNFNIGMQAHFGQLTSAGWHFLDGTGSGQFCDSGSSSSCYLLYATLVSPSGTDFTVTSVNSNLSSISITYQLAGSLNKFNGATLRVWVTTDGSGFAAAAPVTVGADGSIHYTLPARSVVSLTTVIFVRTPQLAYLNAAPHR